MHALCGRNFNHKREAKHSKLQKKKNMKILKAT